MHFVLFIVVVVIFFNIFFFFIIVIFFFLRPVIVNAEGEGENLFPVGERARSERRNDEKGL